ncbi:hypothetical protein [Haliangium sp.]|uniref:hypothetical protein n=1 Tax=Haliangium sp. TaxID=2663208 RepID=UPI003D127424
MAFVLFSGPERVAILAGAVVLAVLAWGAGRRGAGARLVVPAALAAAVLAGSALTELLVSLALGTSGARMTDFNEHRWVLMAPWGRLGLILGTSGAVMAVVLGWWTSARARTPLERAGLVVLRGAAAAAALTLFLQPAVELRQVAREPNHVAVLVDDSRSMALAEAPDGPRRIDRARALLARSGEAFAAWRERHHIDVFRFSETLVPGSLSGLDDEPVGAATRIHQALDQVRARYDGDELAGIVLISDGVATGSFADLAGAGAGASAPTGTGAGEAGADGLEAAGEADEGGEEERAVAGLSGAEGTMLRDFLGALSTRVHTVWVGRGGLRDVSVARVLADEFAFARTVVRIEAVIRATGYERRRVRVTLSSDGQALRQTWVEVGAGATEVPVVFEITPPQVGKYVYEISTPVAEDEAVAENNRRAFVMRVIRDKIRVLQVAGQPSWDVHALRRMLKKNPNVDLISFFILRNQHDLGLSDNSEMSLIPFPTHELFQDELPSFDLIFVQNFAYGPYGIGRYLENIRSYVEGGGSLVMLGGAQSFSSGGYARTPVAAALPVELLPGGRWGLTGAGGRARPGGDELLDLEPFSPELTKAGGLHPITSLRYAVDDNRAAWAALPALEGVNLVARARPGAVVLATHPRLRTQGGEPMPVIVAGEYGEGRVLAVTTDSLWRWGFVAAARPGDDGRHYAKLWENAMRWLIRDPDLLQLHVESDAVSYLPGETVRLDVRLLDLDYTPRAGGKVRLRVRRGSDAQSAEQVVEEVIEVGEAGTGRTQLDDLEPGVYRVEAEAELGDRTLRDRDIFLVRAAGAELARPAADESLLVAIAALTGGTYLGPAEALPEDLPFAPPRIVRVDRRADVELWSRPLLLILALLFLAAEWVLRRRSGYL